MKTVRIIVILVAIALIVFCAYLAMSFYGNPILLITVNNSAPAYIEEKYPDLNLQIDGVYYDFKLGYYMVAVSDPEREDCYFTIYYNGKGEPRDDTYEGRYLSGLNTALRIEREYNLLVESVFTSGALDYDFDISYGFIEYTNEDESNGRAEYAIPYSSLELDGEFSVKEIGARAGVLTVYIKTDDVSYEALASALLSIRKAFDEADVTFRAIDLTLMKGEYGQDGRTMVIAFDYSEIYEDGLVERATDAALFAEEYYRDLDREKEAELG